MNRKLIILSNDGGKEEFLPGVKEDKERFFSFFTSPEGGAWERSEIFAPVTNSISPAALDLYMMKQESERHVDYWLVVFCGHGGATPDGRTYFNLQNDGKRCFEEQIMKYARSSRLLLIADSCRYVPEFENGGVIRQRIFCSESLNTDILYRKICRDDYNRQIEAIPLNTVFRGYATRFTEYAEEYEDGTGGYYSQSLIDVSVKEINAAIKYREEHSEEFNGDGASFSWIHSKAKQKVIELSKSKQTPVYYSPRTNQPPFYVVPSVKRF